MHMSCSIQTKDHAQNILQLGRCQKPLENQGQHRVPYHWQHNGVTTKGTQHWALQPGAPEDVQTTVTSCKHDEYMPKVCLWWNSHRLQ